MWYLIFFTSLAMRLSLESLHRPNEYLYPIADVAEEAVVLIFDVDTVLVNVRRLDVLAVSRFFLVCL